MLQGGKCIAENLRCTPPIYHKSNVQLQHRSPPASVNFINCQPRDQTLWQIPQKISQFFGDYNTKTTMKIIQWRLCVCQNWPGPGRCLVNPHWQQGHCLERLVCNKDHVLPCTVCTDPWHLALRTGSSVVPIAKKYNKNQCLRKTKKPTWATWSNHIQPTHITESNSSWIN